MIGIECCGNSLGLGTLMIFNLHFVCEVVMVIIEVMTVSTPSKFPEKIPKSCIFYMLAIVCASLASAFYGIFHDKPFFMLPQIAVQICILFGTAVNVFSWIYLSHLRILVITELSDHLEPPKDIKYFNLYVKIVLGSLFVVLYFYFLMVVMSFYRKLRKESKFKLSVMKSSAATEEIIL